MPTKQRHRPTPVIGDTVTYQGTEHIVDWVGHGGDPVGPLRVEIRPAQHSGPAFEVDADELDR